MRLLRVGTLALCLLWVALPLCTAQAAPPKGEQENTAGGRARARDEASGELELASPYAPLVREHYYRILARSPTKAFFWELALPGAGHIYNGFPIQAGVAIGLSCLGAALWIAGAVSDSRALWWAGAGTFAAGRLYGLISAPVTAALLNAVYRRQFGITGRF